MPERLSACVSEAFLPNPPSMIGVAVSGGSDSMALLHLLHDFCGTYRIDLQAVTVDHRLRPEAAAEADMVAQRCATIGVPHTTLTWDDWHGQGNLQGAARDARYRLMARWAVSRGIDTVALGHTLDDQAETVLMRLSRRSGVDGLSAMARRSLRDGVTWVRPLLAARRAVLRQYLTEKGIGWSEDPGNEDDRYERIKVRKALDVLGPLGISTEVLGDVAENMGQARKALEWQTFLAARKTLEIKAGAIVLDVQSYFLQPEEIQRRLMVHAVNWISGGSYGPRRAALSGVISALRIGQAATLDGCHFIRNADRLWVFREFNAVRTAVTPTDMLWDGRWRMTPSNGGRHDPALRVRALGPDGLVQCRDWRASGLPHPVAQSTPSVWRDEELVAAPLVGQPGNWAAAPCDDPDTFFAALLSH